MSTVKENKNCPYCLSPVGDQEEKVRCPKCGVIHHADCWKANGSCSVYGCDGWAQWSAEIAERIAPDAGDQVDLSPAAVQTQDPRTAVQCINCGRPVKQGRLLCHKCSRSQLSLRMDNCFGPGLLIIVGLAVIATLVVRALV